LGRRSRKRSAGSKGTAAQPKPSSTGAPAGEASVFSRARARTEARNAQARAKLDPLPPGERPPAVTVAAFVAVALAVANVALWAAGVEVRGQRTSAVGVGAFAVLMLAAALGLWRARYWAVLGFEALLGLTIVIAALSLVVASNVAAVLLCVGIIALAGPLFWKLIRAMARIQMPDRGPARPDG
jgi:hypothetical protein